MDMSRGKSEENPESLEDGEDSPVPFVCPFLCCSLAYMILIPWKQDLTHFDLLREVSLSDQQ